MLGMPSATPPLRSAVARKQASTLWLWPCPANELARRCPAVRRWAVTCGARGRELRVARGGARLLAGPGRLRGAAEEQALCGPEAGHG